MGGLVGWFEGGFVAWMVLVDLFFSDLFFSLPCWFGRISGFGDGGEAEGFGEPFFPPRWSWCMYVFSGVFFQR